MKLCFSQVISFAQLFTVIFVALTIGGTMRILICNDDGIMAPGIIALAQALTEIGEVTVAAPNGERSAASNSITLSSPLRVQKVKFPVEVKNAFSISGMPADCVKVALSNLVDQKPDLVVSGINRGPNMCVDVFYSGTVAAAFEGAFKGILSVAVSLDSFDANADFNVAAAWAKKCIKKLVEADVPKERVYNINVPALNEGEIRGVKLTKLGKIDYREKYLERKDPYGKPYYWIQGDPIIVNTDENCDINTVKSGYVSLTPLKPELTDFEAFNGSNFGEVVKKI